jgi:hypothetical protein
MNYRGQSDVQIVRTMEDHIRDCECLIVVVNRHSTSVGIEIGMAQKYSLPILCLAPEEGAMKKDESLTRTITGLAALGNVLLWRYAKEENLYRLIVQFMSLTFPKDPTG